MPKRNIEKFKGILVLFLGVVITASIVSILDVIQGLILGDWSGIHPYGRIYILPIYVGFAFPFGVIIVAFFWSIKEKTKISLYRYFKLGLILGLVGISSLTRPWLEIVHFDYFVIMFIYIFSFTYFFK